MKKFLLLAFIVPAFIACKSSSNSQEQNKNLAPVDNAASYQNSILTDVGSKEPLVQQLPQTQYEAPRSTKRRVSAKSYPTRQDPPPVVYAQPAPPVVSQPQAAPPVVNPPTTIPVPSPTASTGTANIPSPTGSGVGGESTGNGNVNTGDASGNGNASTIPTENKKKGWSDAAKGAAIGGVGGAVAGAVINGKNRGKGAVIGGVIGAAGGYILGRKRDKQSGRTDYVIQ